VEPRHGTARVFATEGNRSVAAAAKLCRARRLLLAIVTWFGRILGREAERTGSPEAWKAMAVLVSQSHQATQDRIKKM